MSLKNLYLLRILQLEIYISMLQLTINICRKDSTVNEAIHKQNKFFEERKELRRFLNMTELWRF